MTDSRASYSRTPAFRTLLFIVYNVLVAAVVVESILLVTLHAPRVTARTPRPFRRLVQQVYRHFNRSLIQFDPRCARYDPGLTYTLKPGVCTFGNIEFTNTYRINHAGVRDDETALAAPAVIVIGDSHAMGWGVDQDQAVPQLLARKTGLKVLNAAVSSYGTVREMMLLDRLDTSQLRTLIVQYTDNDLLENRAFRENNGRLPIMAESDYRSIVRHYASQRSYYPGKYVLRLFMKVSHLEAPEPDQMKMDPAPPAEEAELFINALTHAGRGSIDQVRVVVFEVNEQIRPPRPFIAALEAARHDEQHPEFVRRLTTLDVAPLLTADDFYVLDDHMNRRGHEKVATALAALLQQ
jgi:hypothetical protein